MSGKKIYPKVKTEKGLAFLFRNNGKSYLIKFAGNPMLLIEQAYIEMGGEDFIENYKLAKEGKLQDKEIKERLEDAVSCARTICRMIQNISDRGKAPLVVYVSDVA